MPGSLQQLPPPPQKEQPPQTSGLRVYKPTLVLTSSLSSFSSLGKTCLAGDEVTRHRSAGTLGHIDAFLFSLFCCNPPLHPLSCCNPPLQPPVVLSFGPRSSFGSGELTISRAKVMVPVLGAGFASVVKLGPAGRELEVGKCDLQGPPGTTALLPPVGFKALLNASNFIKTSLRETIKIPAKVAPVGVQHFTACTRTEQKYSIC